MRRRTARAKPGRCISRRDRLRETETVAVVDGAGPETEVEERVRAAVSPYFI